MLQRPVVYTVFTVHDEADKELFSVLGVSRPDLSSANTLETYSGAKKEKNITEKMIVLGAKSR